MKKNKIIILFFIYTFFISTNIKSSESPSLGELQKSYPGIAQLLHGDVLTLAKDLPTSYGEHIIAAGRFLSVMGATGYVNQTVFNESRILHPNDNKHKHAFLAAAAATIAGYLTTKVVIPLTPEPLINRVKSKNQEVVNYFVSHDAHLKTLVDLAPLIKKEDVALKKICDAHRQDVLDKIDTDENLLKYRRSRSRLGDELQLERAYAALKNCTKFCNKELHEMKKRFRYNELFKEEKDAAGLIADLENDICKLATIYNFLDE